MNGKKLLMEVFVMGMTVVSKSSNDTARSIIITPCVARHPSCAHAVTSPMAVVPQSLNT